MNTVGEREINTQGRAIHFFQDVLGYEYLSNWQDRANNSNIEKELLIDWLTGRGYDNNIIKKVLLNHAECQAQPNRGRRGFLISPVLTSYE